MLSLFTLGIRFSKAIPLSVSSLPPFVAIFLKTGPQSSKSCFIVSSLILVVPILNVSPTLLLTPDPSGHFYLKNGIPNSTSSTPKVFLTFLQIFINSSQAPYLVKVNTLNPIYPLFYCPVFYYLLHSLSSTFSPNRTFCKNPCHSPPIKKL